MGVLIAIYLVLLLITAVIAESVLRWIKCWSAPKAYLAISLVVRVLAYTPVVLDLKETSLFVPSLLVAVIDLCKWEWSDIDFWPYPAAWAALVASGLCLKAWRESRKASDSPPC